jgi:hypothetical protein
VSALQHHDLAPHQGGKILGPVAEWRQRGTRRQADADRRHAREIASLNDGVGEVRGADHDGVDRTGGADRGQQLTQRRSDATSHVGRCRRLDRVNDGLAVEQDGVGVGATDVDSDAPHANTDLKSRS